METFLLIILLVVILALLIGVKNTLSTQVGLLQKKLDVVAAELKLLQRDIQEAPAPTEKKLDLITGELRLLRQDIQQKPLSAEKKTIIEDIAAAHKAPAV